MFSLLRQHAGLIALGTVGLSLTVAAGLIVVLSDEPAEPDWQQPAARPEAVSSLGVDAGSGADVIAADIETVVQTRDIWKLAAIHDVHPEQVASSDPASQMIARSAMVTGDDQLVDDLIAQWEGESESPHAWLCMKADRHLRAGAFDQAREVLLSQEFEGDQDAGRQLRLAMLDAADDPLAALERVNTQITRSPRHGDAHLMRAQLLEGLGRLPEARVSYVTALAATPTNPFYRYELASFYRRRGDLRFALQTWEESLDLPSPEPGWLKTAFWSRVAHPQTTDRTMPAETLGGRIGELARFVHDLPDDRFFDDAAFLMLPSARGLKRRHQEVYWLSLLEHLRQNDIDQALDILDKSTFREQSWNVVLEDSLRSLLTFRKTGRLVARTPRSFGGRGAASVHPFVAALSPEYGSEPSESVAEFLQTSDAVAMTLLACGWMEAALRMPHREVCRDDSPHRMAYAMTQAYRSNRSPDEAFRFAIRQPQSPALDTIIGEMHLARGEADEALQMWRLATADPGPAGYRASWMLATELLGRNRLGEAARTVRQHTGLSSAVIGQELLARIALQRGDVEQAVAIYEGIATESIDARLFAIQRRLASGTDNDLTEALEIGEELFAVHPDIPSVRRLVLRLSDLQRERTR